MSLFRRLFGGDPSDSRQGAQDIDALLEKLAEALAHSATTYPPAEMFHTLLSQSGYKAIHEDRLRFSLSIANEVLNIWLINDCIPVPHRAKQVIDLVHRAFFKVQARKGIRIGDFIVTTAELAQISREVEKESNARVSNVQAIRTNWWSLMNMIYPSRQETYYEALKSVSSSSFSDGFGPTTTVAFELASHLTGADAKSGGDSFVKLAAGLDAFLTGYAKRAQEMLPKLR